MKLKLQSSTGENVLVILQNLSTLLRLNINNKSIENVEFYSSYPSLESLGIALEGLGINNLSVGIDSQKLLLAPTPCVLHLNKDNGHFVILNEVTENDKFVIHDPSKGWYTIDLDELNNLWSGAALLMERPAETTNHSFNKLKNLFTKEYNTVIVLILLTLTYIGFSLSPSIMYFIPSLAFLFGLCICLYLTKEDLEQDKTNSVCKIAENFDCKTVLKSDGAKIFNILKLSDLGVCYFLFFYIGWNVSLINGSLNQNLQYFQLISFSSLFFIPFSIGYQWLKIKTWCIMCLTVQAILFFIATILLLKFEFRITPIKQLDANLIGIAVYSVIVSFILKSLFKIKFSIQKTSWKLNKFLYDTDLFNYTLSQSTAIDPKTLPKLVENGDPDSNIHIVIVTDPFCDSCLAAHNQLNQIKKILIDGIYIKTIFYTEHSKDPINAKIVSEHILSLPKNIQSEALERWFELRDLDKWKSLYNNINHSTTELQEHNEWCHLNSILFTPVIYFNYRQINNKFEVSDLYHHIITINREIKYQNA